ncbi:hypothetical protein TIFTF001_035031 [Ficus carica]|uniref:Uncharacterized protein n=1 Tax=Ficus carica TaxID=3494 RepID=A0AA88E411_FICCA|nr:hypothetical protein TIFTF001_035031 [Ficus carica]
MRWPAKHVPFCQVSQAREACSPKLRTMRCPLPKLAGLRWSLELALANQQARLACLLSKPRDHEVSSAKGVQFSTFTY